MSKPKKSAEEVKETCRKIGVDLGVHSVPKQPHFKDKYNQTHSPFGLADELRGIETTKEREQFSINSIRL